MCRARSVRTPLKIRILYTAAAILLAAPAFGQDPGSSAFRARPGHGPPRPDDCDRPRGRPNFVVVVTDDLDAASVQFMPRVRSLLAEQGVTFRNSFVTNPVCCPSMAAMLTGQYSRNNGILHNVPPLGGFQKFVDSGGDQSTLATWLRNSGYRTGRVGKYLVGYPIGSTYIPPGWDVWHSTYDGFSPYFNYFLNENGVVVPYGAAEGDYLTDVLARRALEFLVGSELDDDRPFFLIFAPTAPHGDSGPNGPPTPAPRHLGLFAGATAPRPPSFNEADVSDKPPALAALPLLSAAQIAAIDGEYRARLESLQAVDEAVEQIVEELDELDELDDTYIVFTSDNGYHLGQHRQFNGKAEAYEEDIRVPLLVRGPAVPEDTTRDEFALNIDLAPTICELAGALPGRTFDGRSLLPLLDDRGRSPRRWRKDFLVEIYRPLAQLPREPGLALRTERETYVEYASGFRELYRLHQDPYQLDNLAPRAGPGYLRKLSRRLAELTR